MAIPLNFYVFFDPKKEFTTKDIFLVNFMLVIEIASKIFISRR
jgi:hypothetical protein